MERDKCIRDIVLIARKRADRHESLHLEIESKRALQSKLRV